MRKRKKQDTAAKPAARKKPDAAVETVTEDVADELTEKDDEQVEPLTTREAVDEAEQLRQLVELRDWLHARSLRRDLIGALDRAIEAQS